MKREVTIHDMMNLIVSRIYLQMCSDRLRDARMAPTENQMLTMFWEECLRGALDRNWAAQKAAGIC